MSEPAVATRDALVAAGRRAMWRAAVAAALVAFLVWNVVFDLWLGQEERQYLWDNARHLAGQGPAVSLRHNMARASVEAFGAATAWAAVVAAAILGASFGVYRAMIAKCTR